MMDRPKKYETIVVEEVVAVIPPHLLDRLEVAERYLVETMSKLEQRYERLVTIAKKINHDLIDCGQRVSALEETVEQHAAKLARLEQSEPDTREKVRQLWDWRSNFTGRWAVLAAIVLIVVPILLKVLFDYLARKL